MIILSEVCIREPNWVNIILLEIKKKDWTLARELILDKTEEISKGESNREQVNSWE